MTRPDWYRSAQRRRRLRTRIGSACSYDGHVEKDHDARYRHEVIAWPAATVVVQVSLKRLRMPAIGLGRRSRQPPCVAATTG
jgi:hypothetical protein